MKRYQLLILIVGFIAAGFVGNSNAADLDQGAFSCNSGYSATVINNAVIYQDVAYVVGINGMIANTFSDRLTFTVSDKSGETITHECKR